jgi:hypothetical protein
MRVLACCIILSLELSAGYAWAQDGVSGPELPLVDALRELAGDDLQFLFSSRLVPDSLSVPRAGPPGENPLARAYRLLAIHGLTLRPVQPGVYAVVAGRIASPGPATAPDDATAATEPLREVLITASRYRLGETASGVLRLDSARLDELPSPASDPVRALTRLPGFATDGFSARANIRGGEVNEALVLVDGYPVRSVYHLAGYQGLFSVLDDGLVRGVDVFTGGYPARYGNRMSAVLDFQTVRPLDEPRHSLGLDSFNASARSAGELGWGNAGYVAAARFGTLSPLLRAFAPGVGDPRYADAYARIEHAGAVRLTGNLLWARDELDIVDRDRGEQARIEDRIRYLWVRAEHDFTPAVGGTLWLGQSRIESYRAGTVDSPGIASGSVLDNRASTLWDLRALLVWARNERHVIEAGTEASQESARYDYASSVSFAPAVQQLFGLPPALTRASDLLPRRRRHGAFVSSRWQLGRSVFTELGLRGQGIVTSGLEADWLIEPRLAVRWEFGPRTRLNLSLGRFHQADEVHELKIEDGLENFPAPQRSDHLVAGIEHQFDPNLALRAEIFRKRQNNPRARFENLLNRRTILPEIAPDRVRVLPDYGEIDGLELSARYQWHPWAAWLAISHSNVNDETAGVHTARSWSQKWSVSAGASWERGPWAANAALMAHSGFPITPLGGARNAQRLPSFLQLDLRLRYTQPLRRGDLVYSAELFNATNRFNACCTELRQSDGMLYGVPLRGVPLLPSLGLRWSW